MASNIPTDRYRSPERLGLHGPAQHPVGRAIRTPGPGSDPLTGVLAVAARRSGRSPAGRSPADDTAQPSAGDAALAVELTALDTTTADAMRLARRFGLSAVYVRSEINAARRTRPFSVQPPPSPAPREIPAPTPTDAEREAALDRHLTGRPRPSDTVPNLSRRFGLSRVYVRTRLRQAGWPRLESNNPA